MNAKYFAYIGAILNATIVGLSFLFTKIALNSSNPIDTLSFRFTLAFFAITLVMIIIRRKPINLKGLSKKAFFSLFLLALFYPTMFFSFQTFGLVYASSAEGGIILSLSPIFITVFASIFLKEKTTWQQGIFIMLSVLGVIYIFIMKGNVVEVDNFLGFGYLVISCLSIAGYTVLARNLTVNYSPLQLSFIMVSFGFLFFNGYALFYHLNAGDVATYLSLWGKGSFLLSTFYLGVLSTLLTSFLANYVLSKIPASQMSVFANIATVISIAAGATFLNEKIYFYHWMGAALIIIGVIGTNILKEKQRDLF